MGTKYKKWYPYLRNGASQHLRFPSRTPTTLDYQEANNPDGDPALVYPVLVIPANSFSPIFPRSYDLSGFEGLTNTGEVVQPVDPDSVFAVRDTFLRLPRVVLVVNGCDFDRNHGLVGYDACGIDYYPQFPDTALHRAIGLPGALSDVLVPLGIAVYATTYATKRWIEQAVPALADWIGGDVYLIVLTNDSAYKVSHQWVDVYNRYNAGGDSPCGYTTVLTAAGAAEGPGDTDISGPLASWAAGVRRYRNFHGLCCAIPWEGDSVNRFSQSGGITVDDHVIVFRLDLEDFDNRSSMQANVVQLNAASPDVPGDATWEYADVAVDHDYGFYLDKVKTWYGLLG